jgi:hypothetical protein
VKESIAAFRNKKIWNVFCIFINYDKSSWHAFFTTFLILYDLIHLWFSFLNDRFVFMFLMNNHILSLITYSDENALFWFAWRFWLFCALTSFFLINFQISFIFSTIKASFYVNIRSLIDNRSRATFDEFDKSKLMRDSYS